MPIWNQLGMQAAGNAMSGAMGLILGNINDRRQLRQQQKLQDQQIKGTKELTDYNYLKQMQMWNETNYPAQMAMLKKAGLNPALIYDNGGMGAETSISPGDVQGAEAPKGGQEIQQLLGMGLQGQSIELQRQMQQAQIANLNAQTAKTKAETGNVPLTGQQIQAEILNLEETRKAITAGIQNTQAQTRLSNLHYDIEDFGLQFDKMTADDRANAIRKQNEHIDQTIKNLKTTNKIDEHIANNKEAMLKAELALTIMSTWLKGEEGKAAQQSVKESIQKISDIINDNMHQAEKGHTPDRDLGIKNGLDEDFPAGLLSWLNIFIPIGGGGIIPRGTKPPEVSGFKTSKQ